VVELWGCGGGLLLKLDICLGPQLRVQEALQGTGDIDGHLLFSVLLTGTHKEMSSDTGSGEAHASPAKHH
jgi:hypothetical protein